MNRRSRLLAQHVGRLLPPAASVLVISDADTGLLAALASHRRDLTITRIDVPASRGAASQDFVAVRPPLPVTDASVDVVVLLDVLHRTEAALHLLAEATRIAREAVVIKDCIRRDWADDYRVWMLDWARRPRGRLPAARCWSAGEWTLALQRIGAAIESWETDLRLHAWPVSALVGPSLHFVARVGAGPALRRA